MCIRDSLAGIYTDLFQGAIMALASTLVFAAAMASGGGLGAVSYTHLRAHETVLDLVCRLLL